MSLFSTALTKTLSDLDWSQKHLAEITGLLAPQVNRYARGTSTIAMDTVAKIIDAVPESYRSDLLVAFLKDHTPEQFTNLVSILTNTITTNEAPTYLPEGLDDALRSDLLYLSQLCMRHKEVRDMVENFCRLMRPK